MSKLKLSGKELRAIGYPEGPVISIAMNVMQKNLFHCNDSAIYFSAPQEKISHKTRILAFLYYAF